MTDLAINMSPLLELVEKMVMLTFKSFLVFLMGAWTIFWTRAIYRLVIKK